MHFYWAWVNTRNLTLPSNDHFGRVLVCSSKKKMRLVYKDSSNINICGRVTHKELVEILSDIENNSDIPILLEDIDSEFYDLRSLREARLIAYLAGI